MTEISCGTRKCRSNNFGICQLSHVALDEDGQCIYYKFKVKPLEVE